MNQFSDKEQIVYNMLQDEKSRQCFAARKYFTQTGHIGSFKDLAEKSDGFEDLFNKLKNNSYAVYGAGEMCRNMIRIFKGLQVFQNCKAIFDKNEELHGSYIEDIPILPPLNSGSQHISFDYIVIGISKKSGILHQIVEFLKGIGFQEEQILLPYDDIFFIDKIYFDKEIILPKLKENGIFVDGGSYDFYDSQRFIQYSPSVKKIYAFEPDRKNFEKVNRNASQYSIDIETMPYALWSKACPLYFDSSASLSSMIAEDGKTLINAVSLDDMVTSDEQITFVKLDIEGAEQQALEGMRQMLARDKPLLAISIYHKPYDYVEIPLLIHDIVPEYKMYIRHYHLLQMDTVLYCRRD